MNILTRLGKALNAADEVSPNGAALIGFYGRNYGRRTTFSDHRQAGLDRRVRRSA